MATNVLSVYDPYFYANEELIALEASLGMAGRVYRGYDKEAKAKGSTIEIRRPGKFVAQDAPSSDQNVEASGIEIRLDYWKEVKFSLTDKELTFTGVQIYPPLAQAVADNAVVTVSLMNFTNSVAFHKNAFALGMAPLSDIGEQLGNARVASVVDPRTGLAMRSRIWYAPDASAVKVALDVLYAVKCLDGNLACRLRK